MNEKELLAELQVMMWYYEAFRDPREPIGSTEQDDTDRARYILIDAMKQGALGRDYLTTARTRELQKEQHNDVS